MFDIGQWITGCSAQCLNLGHQVGREELAPYIYTHDQPEAIRHAFRVASGLDSMVIGEPQILGQMKDAVRAAEENGTLGTQLHKLFQRSFSVANRWRRSASCSSVPAK